MRLDFNPVKNLFILRVPTAQQGLVATLMEDHGLLRYRASANTPETLLYTPVDYAAVPFFEYATREAREKLSPIMIQIDASRAPGSYANIKVPADKELWPFQKASIAYALERKHCLIADEPGLGKTPIAIAFANEIRAENVLVLCPASIRLQWAKRIWEWSTMWPKERPHVLLHGRNGTHPTAKWTVASYDLARTEAIGRALSQRRYDLLILDEAHYCKTIDAGRTRAIFGGGTERTFDPLAETAERILALTGTPLPNRPREAYVMARHLCWDSIDWLSEDAFRRRFNPSAKREGTRKDGSSYIYIDERTGHHPELQNRLRANFMARHLKRDVLTQLPEVVHDIVQMDKTEPVKLALKAESLLAIDVDAFLENGFDPTGNLAIVRHQMGVALAPQAASYAATILEGGEDKLVIFAHHIAVLDIIEKKLAPFGSVRIDGSTGARKKDLLINEFISNPKIRVCLGNLMSMGTGTDGLQQVARHVIFAEADWVFGTNQQGIDRLHRGGQDRGVLAEFIVAPGSISEKVLSKSIKKGSVVFDALDKKHTIGH
jgi:SNF2 family DNA or RNA helicase